MNSSWPLRSLAAAYVSIALVTPPVYANADSPAFPQEWKAETFSALGAAMRRMDHQWNTIGLTAQSSAKSFHRALSAKVLPSTPASDQDFFRGIEPYLKRHWNETSCTSSATGGCDIHPGSVFHDYLIARENVNNFENQSPQGQLATLDAYHAMYYYIDYIYSFIPQVNKALEAIKADSGNILQAIHHLKATLSDGQETTPDIPPSVIEHLKGTQPT